MKPLLAGLTLLRPASIPGLATGITTHDHCLGQGLPELTSETEIDPNNYQKEGTTFVDSIENYLSTVLTLNYLPQERRLFKTRSRTDRNLL